MFLPLNDFKANYVRMCSLFLGYFVEVVSRSPPLKASASVFVSGQCKAWSLPLTYSLLLATPQILLKAVPQLDGFKRCSYGRDFGVDGDSGIC